MNLLPVNKFRRLRSHFVNFLLDKNFRKEYLFFILQKRHYHQTYHDTALDRYPELFGICRDYYRHRKKVTILSFGCSTGEEVASLNKYLPQAFVTGVDISQTCLDKCRQQFENDHNKFMSSLSKEFMKSANFDAIFCLAVFQRPQLKLKKEVNTLTNYLFSHFDKQIIELDKKLNVKGLLFIDRCDFRFSDTETSKRYSVLEVENNRIIRNRPVFDSSNKRHDIITDSYRVFVKEN
jgi:SAM-dependent methyltransferase